MTAEVFSAHLLMWTCAWQSTVSVAVGLLGSVFLHRRSSRAHQVLLLSMMAAVMVPLMSLLVRHFGLGVFVAEPPGLESPNEYWGGGPETTGMVDADEREPSRVGGSSPQVLASSRPFTFPWRLALLYGWFAASLILAARLAVTFVLGIRLLNRARPLECDKIERAVHIAKARLGVEKDVQVYGSPKIHSPVIWCWRPRPVLLVSSTAKGLGNSIDWAGVLSHELAHWKRRDHLCGLLAELIVCILPWHPLLWWAKSRLVALSEQACDDWVVATGQSGADYAGSLLELTPGAQMAFVPAVVSSRKGLAGRVRRILRDRCGNPQTGLAWALAVSIVAVCLAVGAALAQTRPAKLETPSERKEGPTKSLLEAATDGDIHQIRLHLSTGTDVNTKGRGGRTALHCAAQEGYAEIARLLIAQGASINAKDKNQQTPLHCAALNGKTETAELLIVKGADVNAEDNRGGTPISCALLSTGGGRQMVELLVSKGAKVPALCLAAHRGDIDKVKNSLEEGTNVDARDEAGHTPLYYAASAGQMHVVEFLLAKGADVTARDKRDETPLYYAAEAGWKNVAELLIAKGADVNARNERRETPLHSAAWQGRGDVAKLLIAKGADITARDQSDYIPLHAAASTGLVEVAELLISKGSDPDARTTWAGTPLQGAADDAPGESGYAIVKLLIDKGARVNAACTLGCTILHHAVSRYQPQPDVVRLLIANGANVNAKTNGGQTPLHSAVLAGHRDIAELLLTKGADIDVKNQRDRTPLDIAVVQGYTEIIDLLRKHGAKEEASVRPDAAKPTGPPAQTATKRDTGTSSDAKPIPDGSDKPAKSLHQAAAEGDIDLVKSLLSKGADVNARDRQGQTALDTAARNGHKALAELLIAQGAEVNARDKSGYTPLYPAIWSKDKGTIRLFIEKGANVNLVAEQDYPPLYYAVMNEDLEIVQLLVAHGAKFDEKTFDGSTVFRSAASQGSREIVDFFVSRGADVSTFHLAACTGDLGRVKRFVEEGAAIDTQDESGWTPLAWAASTGRTETTVFLIARGANVQAQASDGSTPLHRATLSGEAKLIELLISKGAEVNSPDKDGWTPLHFAHDREVAELLIGKGADVNARSRDHRNSFRGWTALHQACWWGQAKDVVELLIAKGADLNLTDEQGRTPLHLAVTRGRAELVRLLVDRGVDVNRKDKRGRTALSLAKTTVYLAPKNRQEMVELLHQHGAME